MDSNKKLSRLNSHKNYNSQVKEDILKLSSGLFIYMKWIYVSGELSTCLVFWRKERKLHRLLALCSLQGESHLWGLLEESQWWPLLIIWDEMLPSFNVTVPFGRKYFSAVGISLTDFGLQASLRGLLACTILHGPVPFSDSLASH